MRSVCSRINLLAVIFLFFGTACLSAQGPATASDGHKVLALDVGTWHVEGKMWMPGADEPMPFEATEVNTMLGEIHLISDFKGNFGGMEYHGHGTASYDPESKVYSSTWIDATETSLSTSKGTWDEKSRTMTMEGAKKGPDGSPMKTKATVVYKPDGARFMTMFSAGEGGEWHKDMELVYTRKTGER
jgi:Protein of unknown function (DUF1579)